MFDIILQNNASKEVTVLEGLSDISTTSLYLQFENVDLSSYEDGEYSYWVINNDRTDVTYEFCATPLDTVINTADGSVKLRDLNPITGLMRIGIINEADGANEYRKGDDTVFYYNSKKTN